jgi:pimeloyl-ACP methyl ester carboxylesterase
MAKKESSLRISAQVAFLVLVAREDDLYAERYRELEGRLFERAGLAARSRSVQLPALGTIHLFEAGAGEPVILLHGGAGIGAEHIPVVALLARRFRVIVPDRPGHGLSDRFSYRGIDLRQANVDFVGALLDSLGLAKAALVGNSYGGYMALCFALARPDRTSRLVILSYAPGVDRALPAPLRVMVAPLVGWILGRTIGRPILANTRRFFAMLLVAQIDRVPPELLELETMHSKRHWDGIDELYRNAMTVAGWRRRYLLGAELPRLGVPTAVVWGERDACGSVDVGRRLAERIAGARFEVLPGAGHMPSTDAPGPCAAALERALA